MLIASCIIGWLIALIAVAVAFEFRQEVLCLRGANDVAKRCIKELQDETQNWANRNGRHAHLSATLQNSMLDIMNCARAALEEVGKSTETVK